MWRSAECSTSDKLVTQAEGERVVLRCTHCMTVMTHLTVMQAIVCSEGVKLVLLFPLFIIRLFVVVMLFLPLALVSFVASLGADLSRPFPRWRRAMVHVLRPITKLVAMCMGFSVHLTGWENYQQALQKNLVRPLCTQWSKYGIYIR